MTIFKVTHIIVRLRRVGATGSARGNDRPSTETQYSSLAREGLLSHYLAGAPQSEQLFKLRTQWDVPWLSDGVQFVWRAAAPAAVCLASKQSMLGWLGRVTRGLRSNSASGS